MKLTKYVLSFFFFLSLVSPANSIMYPKPHKNDSRLRDAIYTANQVYNLSTSIGYATFILLQKGEVLESWFSGDLDAWELLDDRNIVTLKPKVLRASSNLFLYTNKGRVYSFKIAIKEKPYFGLRFSYPDDEKRKNDRLKNEFELNTSLADSVDPNKQVFKNFAYIGAGSNEIKPDKVFDNGHYTFFYFKEGADLPAIFRSTPNGEKLTQKHTNNNWLVVPHVEREWMLRLGDLVMCVRNNKYADQFINNSSTASPNVTLKVKEGKSE